MKISKQQVEHVALLARLELTESEKQEYTEQLNSILEYAAILDKLDTENVPPTAHPLPLKNVFRSDEVKPSIDQKEALSNAPDAEDGFFKVPKIV
ncbi:MAG TPA: Asp-tRNA(Asn)/Glu-tRNA(Gln) amidotransferase subunit GatC [Verrucomicrobiae bacterium]|nr:Asp-tRNA(Asn)/Glu-tRNA(Gln) amidotransferase subunit GatC [Verrucomicrobiae bacterium]